MDAGVEFLRTSTVLWNEKFAVKPRDETSAHRPWTANPEELDDTLARREERVLTKAMAFSSAGTKYCVKISGPGVACGEPW